MALRDWWNRMTTGWSAQTGASSSRGYPTPSSVYGRWADERERYDVLDAYERNEGLYKVLVTELSDAGYEGYESYRSPASRLVELYVAKLTDRLLASLDTGGDTALKGLIEQTYEWSNWKDRVEEAARDLSTHGLLFTKIESVRDEDDEDAPFTRVQRNILDPRTVTEFDVDGRDILTYLRLDVPYEIDPKDSGDIEAVEERCRTEVWDKVTKTLRIWDHSIDPGAKLEDIASDPDTTLIESAHLRNKDDAEVGAREHATGYDFIPVVYRKIKGKAGEKYGRGVFQHALDSIDEINRQSTKLAQMMFPDIYATILRDAGSKGGELPETYASQDGTSTSALYNKAKQKEYRVVDIENYKTLKFPPGASLGWSIPPVDFAGHIAAMDNFTKESIEKDLPELAYYRLREMGDVSGRAAVILMMDVADRIMNIRRKFEDMEVRLNKMALTVAKAVEIEGFDGVGDYASGDLDHTFKPYVLFPVSAAEAADEGVQEAAAISAMVGLPKPILRRFLEKQGYEKDAIEEIITAVEALAEEAKTAAGAAAPGAAAPAATSILDSVRAARDPSAIPGIAPNDARFVGATGELKLNPPAAAG